MECTVNDVLDFRKLECNMFALQKQAARLGPLVDSVCRQVRRGGACLAVRGVGAPFARGTACVGARLAQWDVYWCHRHAPPRIP
jgi:hypothetical protein